jgi:glucokinase
MTAHFETNLVTSSGTRPILGQDVRGLVGDIGGTNARFAVAERTDGKTRLVNFKSLPCADYPDVYACLDAYFAQTGEARTFDYACVAVAGPVKAGRIKLTNLAWEVAEDRLAQTTGARKAWLINDYAALAFSLPHLTHEDTRTIGRVAEGFGDVRAVMGAGTGFGASVLIGGPYGAYCLSTESGHISFAPVNDYEVEIHRYLRERYGRVTVEMLLSGPGLVNLYHAIKHIRGEVALDLTPPQITQLDGPDAQGCRHTVEAFLDILASTCGDLALAQGATAGMFIAGGIPPRLVQHIDDARFRGRMEAKAPMAGLVAAIPSRLIMHPSAALMGAAHALSDEQIMA